MKLATLADGSRDGQLVVVSRDLAQAHVASGIALRLQQLLDDWNFISPQLEDLSATLNGGKARHAFAFDPARCMAPLPRAYGYADRGSGPLLLHADSGDFLGPRDAVHVNGASPGAAVEARLAVVTGDVTPGTDADAAIGAVRLLLLAADWRQCGCVAFAPVALTPDELGSAGWRGGRVHATLTCTLNGSVIDRCDGARMPVHFGELIAHAVATRRLRAGAIVGSGRIDDARPVDKSGAMPRAGDTVRIAASLADGDAPFGAIEQRVGPA